MSTLFVDQKNFSKRKHALLPVLYELIYHLVWSPKIVPSLKDKFDTTVLHAFRTLRQDIPLSDLVDMEAIARFITFITTTLSRDFEQIYHETSYPLSTLI